MQITTTHHIRGLIAATILAIVASGSAAADPSADSHKTVSMIVRYSDLDVSKALDAALLYGRIVTAAHDLCDTYANLNARAFKQAQACVHGAVVDAVTRINQPQMFSIYNARNPEPLPVVLVARQNR